MMYYTHTSYMYIVYVAPVGYLIKLMHTNVMKPISNRLICNGAKVLNRLYHFFVLVLYVLS